MPSTTSRVHPRTVSSVLRLVADWTAGIWDSSSQAFTIPTGLAGRRTTTLSSLPAFRTCYGPPCLSTQGQSRDLQHLSPMLTRCGNIALRDIAHMLVCPIDPGIPHDKFPSLRERLPVGEPLYCGARGTNFLIIALPRQPCQGSASFLNRSSRVEVLAFPWHVQQFQRASVPLAPAHCRVGLVLV
jgi:hypothetical protein